MMPNPPDKSADHAECGAYLRRFFAQFDTDVTVSTLPPIVESPYNRPGDGNGSLTCPHGTTFYFEPTSEQIAAWARDGVA